MTSESYSHHDCSTLRTCNGVFTCNITVFNLRTGHPRATPILRETTGIPSLSIALNSKLRTVHVRSAYVRPAIVEDI